MMVKCKVGNCNYRDDDTEFCRKAIVMFDLQGCKDFSMRGQEEVKEEDKEKLIIEEEE